jgi:MerR family transcriptional regulator, light-induced transcriptional regulator
MAVLYFAISSNTTMKTLTTKEVARLCRVSDATVKRWEEAGVITSERTAGGHRRFRVEEIARFQKDQSLGLKVRHGDESVDSAASRRPDNLEHSESAFFHSLVAGREEEVSNQIISSFLNGQPITEILDTLICPAMNRIGELWSIGKLSIAQEHLATRAAIVAVHKLRSLIPVPELSGKLAICFAIEGDYHELSTQLVQILFESQGWEVINFGSNTPLFALVDEIAHHKPGVICISAAYLSDRERTSRDYSEFRLKIAKHKIPIVFGGRALDEERSKTLFPADLYPSNFTEVAEFSQKILKK